MSIFGKMSGAIGVFALIVFFIAGFGIVSGAELTISSPDVAKPGEPVSMYIGNVDNGNTLNITITGQVKTNAGSPVSVQVRDLTLPVDLSGSTLLFSANNIEGTNGYFSFEGGGYSVDHEALPVVGGSCSKNYGPVDLDAATEYDMSFNATGSKDRSVVNIGVGGIVGRAISTPEKFSFNAGGFTNGIFNAEVKVKNGNTEVATKNMAFTIQDSLLAYN